jgi:light-regulated signal transduction histidine kinase (bacteriophytochrome)
MIAQDIHKTDLLVNGLLNYFKVTSPIKKTNTVNNLIEEVLKKHRIQLEEKGAKLIKKLEKDLPEIIVPDKQLRFILNSILQYAVTLMPSHETLGFLTQSFVLQERHPEQTLFRKDKPYVETTLFFTGFKRPVEPFGMRREIEAVQEEDSLGLILRLVKEMVHRNRGVMKLQGDKKEAKLFISLEFPVERRTVLHDPNDH